MKKLISVLLILAMFLPACALADRMIVHVTAMSLEAPSIGSNWKSYYQLGDYELRDGDIFDISVGPMSVFGEITDYDSTPDVGYNTTNVNVTDSRLRKGFTVEQQIEVVENGGRNKGYSALWYVYYEFTPIGDYTVLN